MGEVVASKVLGVSLGFVGVRIEGRIDCPVDRGDRDVSGRETDTEDVFLDVWDPSTMLPLPQHRRIARLPNNIEPAVESTLRGPTP